MVEISLNQDLGTGDITADLIDANTRMTAKLITRENAVLCGQAWFEAVFKLLSDDIDIDWCLRAKKKNYAIISINTVITHHNLGQSSINIFGHNYIIHSPVRMYYYFRNAILLYKKEPFDVRWKFADFFRNLMKFVSHLLTNSCVSYFDTEYESQHSFTHVFQDY